MRQKRKNKKRLTKKNEDTEDAPTEVLSQAEINQLLAAINAGEEDEPEDFRPAHNSRKIKIYDFKRPDKFSKDNVRTIAMIHENFARLMTNYLSSILKIPAHVFVASVDQLTYEEFIRSIPTPTCIGVINMDPLKGNAIIEIDPAVTFAIIHLLVDGSPDFQLKCQHELTDIETSIMEDVFIRILSDLRYSWDSIIDLRPKVGQIDTNPQFCQIVHPTEMTVMITFEVRVGETEGIMNFCIPYSTIENIIDKFSITTLYNIGRKKTEKQIHNINNADIELTARLFKKIVTFDFLKNLKVDDLIYFPLRHGPDLCYLLASNQILYKCHFDEKSPNIQKTIIVENKININEGNYMETKNNVQPGVSLNDIQIQLSVELGRTKLPIKDILKMGEGTIIELDKLAGEPVDLFANNVLIAKGEVVVIDENFGLRIVEILDKSKGE